jgi:outer membrane scaffolding protein for murein synthesis (MipA/OmpV family)
MKALLALAGLIFSQVCAAQDRPTIIGAAIRSRPAYDGSSSQVTDFIPQLRYYGSLWFARTTQGILEGGIRNELAPEFWAGAQIAYEAGRKKSEAPFLETLGEPDIKTSASVGLHVEWDRHFGRMPVNFLIRARQNFDTDLGGEADLRVNLGVFQRWGLEGAVFGQATWGTANALQSRYGAADPGLLFVSAGFLAGYDVTRHWLIVGSFEYRKLYDQAAQSVLTERTTNHYVSAGLAYRF